jgi:3-oxoacyl-[acyl-carrier protein] reductase
LTKEYPVAIVTGGARRLGRHIIISLAKNGYNVVVNYNTAKREAVSVISQINEIGRKGIAIKADISQKNEVQRLVSRTIKLFGRVDLLVNNAAVFVESPLEKTTEQIWDTTIDINLKGTFLCSQAVAPFMLKQKFGRIINIASLGGLQPWAKHLPYSVSKAGDIMLTKILAKSLAPYIHVNAIAPGIIALEKSAKKSVVPIKSNKILLRKYGKPSDITDLIIFLAKTEQYITGQVFPVDGGKSIQ